MTIPTPFSYRQGNSVLFRMDVRCKIVCICILSIVIVNADFLHLSLVSTALFWLLYRSGSGFKTFLREFRYLFIILFFVFIVRVLVTEGTPLHLPQNIKIYRWMIDTDIFMNINITKEGLADGSRIVWRFFVIMLMGVIFSSSTSASSIKSAIQWFLEPIPFIPEKKVSLMVSLFARFLPVILEKAYEVSDAQKARCAHLQKNPLRRIVNFTVPIVRKVFTSADTLAIAMASRCYNDNIITPIDYPPLLHSGYEMNFYIGTIILSAIIIFL